MNQFSPTFRSSRPELDLCTELGIAFLPWSPLGGISHARRLGARHLAFTFAAQELHATPQQVCLAWILSLSPVVIPIPGSSRPQTAHSSAAAVDLRFPAEQLALLYSA
ncbi:aldo/keto reductase [Streptomyces sp. NPDC096354]|uniref:aldo/keto reductase n=1 Tax=Streptomyces sp. NPDC096354 TaxID=3366088 RepID=UPI0037F7EB0B